MREVRGPEIRQSPFDLSMWHATQSGSAVGYLAYPSLGGPGGGPRYRFPIGYLRPESAGLTYQSARRRGRIPTHWPMTWSYAYERPGVPFKP